jgi:hypothetical protein
VETSASTGSMLISIPSGVRSVSTPRPATSPLKLITPPVGAMMSSPAAARSRPRWPGPHGVLGARKSRRIRCSPSVGHAQTAAGAGGRRSSRTRARVPGIIRAVCPRGSVSAGFCDSFVHSRGGASNLDNCADTVRTPWTLRYCLPFLSPSELA